MAGILAFMCRPSFDLLTMYDTLVTINTVGTMTTTLFTDAILWHNKVLKNTVTDFANSEPICLSELSPNHGELDGHGNIQFLKLL